MTQLKQSKEMFLPQRRAILEKSLVRSEYRSTEAKQLFLGMLLCEPHARLLLLHNFQSSTATTRHNRIDASPSMRSWRDRGELAQLPWSTPCSGLLLVVDLSTSLAGLQNPYHAKNKFGIF